MEIHALVPLIASVIYVFLFVVIAINRPWQRQHKLVACYLIAAGFWALSDFFLRSDLFLEHKLLIFRIVICASMWWVVQLYYFARSFLNLSGGLGVRFGYASLAIFITLATLGYAPPGITSNGGIVNPMYGWWFAIYLVPLVTLAGLGVRFLVQRFKTLTEPKERNKLGYLLAAIGLLVILGFIGTTPLAKGFPISHLGGLLSVCILTYAVIRHELVSINVILRRGVGWLGLGVAAVTVYSLLFFLFHWLTGIEFGFGIIATAIVAAILTAIFIYWLSPTLFETVDRAFYRERHGYRRKLFDFVRNRLGTVFDLDELSRELLPPLTKALDCQQTYMLLPEIRSEDFVTEFAEPDENSNPPLRIKQDNPVVEWLRTHNRCLTREQLDILPEFTGLWEEEKNEFRNSGVELFFPLISRDNMVGILLLGKKQTGRYTLEDVNLVESIVNQVSINLEKEYLHEQLAKREEELSLINRLARLITSNLNIQEVYDAFIAELKGVVDIDWATIALIEGGELHFQALSTDIGSDWEAGDKILLKGTATEWVAIHKKALFEPDLARRKKFGTGESHFQHGIRSTAYLPLLVKDEAIGSLIIASRHPNAYNQRQIQLLERLALQIAMPIENARLYSRAEQRARIDELTGLFNRRHFDERLKQEISQHSRYGGMASLVLMDLDLFKKYNDSMGHLAGDKLLTQVGQLIKDSLRDTDIAFRYGGDEFAIILPKSSTDEAYIVAERVRGVIAVGMEKHQVHVTASLGLASWPSDGITPDEIVNSADKALYYGKQTGGNRTCIISRMLQPAVESAKPANVERETLSTIYALAATIEARDQYTYGHSRKVSNYAVALAEAVNLPPERVAVVSTAALLHDIGKIGIPDEVLNKSTKLDSEEWELIRSHPKLSAAIVGHVPSLTPCLPAILHHHERWDGKGYPSGLKGDSIPVEARILTIADVFEAMTSSRPYRAPLCYREAIEELKRNAGSQLDPELVDIFLPIALATAPEELGLGQSPIGHKADL